MRAIPLIGVVGLGSIGRRHARLLAETSVEPVPVLDPEPTAARDLAHVRPVASFAELLAACEGVVIATPDPLHAPLTVQACDAGVAALVEKPISDTLDGASAIAAAAGRTGTAVLVGHVLRHTAILGRVRHLLASGAIGNPVSFHATLGAYETLEVARMRFDPDDRYRLPFDYVHEWDYLHWLLGPIERVIATSHTSGDLPLRQHPNVIDALLVLQSGVTGTVHLDYVQRQGDRAVRIVGDRGTCTVDVRSGALAIHGADGMARHEDHPEERDDAFRRQLAHFVDVIGGDPPIVDIDEATRAIAVAAAVVRSCEDGTWQHLTPSTTRRPTI